MERFGKFQLLERIGEGGMAEIFLAKPSDASISKLVAVKRILPQFADDPLFRENFRREGAIAMQFRHHAIIGVHEMGVVDDNAYLSMEYFPGKSLANIMTTLKSAKASLPLSDRVTIIKSIAEALQYIHDFSDYGEPTEIIHRDISPHNIMVGFDGATKLIDFGIAKDTSHENTQSKMMKGKIAYMSPEQVRGDKLTKQTDIFSLGIVFWELLAGKKLFTGKTINEISTKVQACQIPSIFDFAPDVPAALALICSRALMEDVRLRYRSAGDFAADLDGFLRLLPSDGQEKGLAKAIQGLFPGDFTNLKKLLKSHEGAQEIAIRTVPTASTAVSRTSPGRITRARVQSKASHLARGFGVASALVLALTIYLGFVRGGPAKRNLESPKPLPPVVTFTPPTPPTSFPALAPLPTPLPVAVTPPPMPKPAPTVAVTPPPPAPAVPMPVIAAQPKVKMPAVLPEKSISNANTLKTAAEPKAKLDGKRRVKKLVKIERKVASKAKMASFAYVTVIADPNSQILVNGKMVGTEIVNEMKVPAGKPVTLQVRSASGGPTKSKKLTFVPLSRNVIEMGGSAGSPAE